MMHFVHSKIPNTGNKKYWLGIDHCQNDAILPGHNLGKRTTL